jgi:DNA-binding MarR family transcriptional regulator
MVVRSNRRRDDKAASVDPATLDLGYLAFFLGRRINDLIVERGLREGFAGTRESHGYVLQHLIDSERTITELGARMQVTQQAASKMVAELVKLKYLEVHAAEDRREKRVRLSARGWETIHFARRSRRRLDARLRRVAGTDDYEQARQVLLTCLAALGGISQIRRRRIPQPR